jgi:outer membrane murein-binding lipoprotein Lpp
MQRMVLAGVVAIALAGCSGGSDASQQAEIERLRAETEKLRAESEQLRQQNAQRQAEWEAGAAGREIDQRINDRYFGGAGNRSNNPDSAAVGALEASEPNK